MLPSSAAAWRCTSAMSSSERISPDRGGLVGVVSFGAPLARDRTLARVSQAVRATANDVVVEPAFAVAHGAGRVHRHGAVVCAFEGRLANAASLCARLGCPEGAMQAKIAAIAYSKFGEDAVTYFRGEFVLALWDRAARRGLICRDPLGARTAFIRIVAGEIAFASDLKWLLRMLTATPDLDPVGVSEWLVTGGASFERTLYSGVRRLSPGTSLVFDRNGWQERRYWEPRYSPPLRISRDDAAVELRRALAATVSPEIQGSDVIGVLLSGGLD